MTKDDKLRTEKLNRKHEMVSINDLMVLNHYGAASLLLF
jgi:hypothetical protein